MSTPLIWKRVINHGHGFNEWAVKHHQGLMNSMALVSPERLRVIESRQEHHMPTARLLDDIATDLDLKQLWDLTEHIASLLNKALNMRLWRIGFVFDHHDVS